MHVEGDDADDSAVDVVVVGGGVAGLIAASSLAAEYDVLLLEAQERIGGRVESIRRGEYWVNVGAQFAEGTGALFDALDRLGLPRGSLAGKKTALAVGGRLVAANNPGLVLLRCGMPLAARAELLRVGVRVRLANRRALGKAGSARAREFRSWLDDQPGSYLLRGVRSEETRRMVEAWSGQWIGCDPDETGAAQLVYSVATALEKAGKVPNFSLPLGGNQSLTDALASELGSRVQVGARVQTVSRTEHGVTIEYVQNGRRRRVSAARAIVTVPADVLPTIMPDLPEQRRRAISGISYGQYVLAGVFTTERGRQRWDDFYAISTPDMAFQMVFNHAAALRQRLPRAPGGALTCFAGGSRARELAGRSDDDIRALFQRDLARVLPELDGYISEVVVRRQERVVPYWKPGERAAARQLRDPLGPVHFAGDYLLGFPSMADAAEAGARAASAVRASLG